MAVSPTPASAPSDRSSTFAASSGEEICRICHCEGDDGNPLITPCRCSGSLRFVHRACLLRWLQNSDTSCCELCKYEFKKNRFKLHRWEGLQMTSNSRGALVWTVVCLVAFNVVTITTMVLAIYYSLITSMQEVKNGSLNWTFWIMLLLMAVTLSMMTGMLVTSCRIYIDLWRRLKIYNWVVCPDTVRNI